MMALTDVFHVDAETNAHQLPVKHFYQFLFAVICLRSCTHMISLLCLVTDATSSDSWFIIFKILMLNITVLTILLHLRKFCLFLGLGCVSDYSQEIELPPQKNAMLVYQCKIRCRTYSLNCSHGNLSVVIFFIKRRHHYWIVTAVYSLNCSIVVVDQSGSSTQHLVNNTGAPHFGTRRLTFHPHIASLGSHCYMLVWLVLNPHPPSETAVEW